MSSLPTTKTRSPVRLCPACATPLEQRAFQLTNDGRQPQRGASLSRGAALFVADLEVDGCPSCGGVWLDQGELRALASDEARLRALDECFVQRAIPFSQDGEARLCPICAIALCPIEYDAFRGIRLDNCPKCDGVWLDHGEAGAIADRLFSQSRGSHAASAPAAIAPDGAATGSIHPRQMPTPTAPVHSGPRPGQSPSIPIQKRLREADTLTIRQTRSFAEALTGFDRRSRYEILLKGRAIAFAEEQGTDHISRDQFGHRNAHAIIATDPDGAQLFALHTPRPNRLREEVNLLAPDGRRLGKFQKRLTLGAKGFDVFDADGMVVMNARAPILSPWTFTFSLDGRGELGQIHCGLPGIFAIFRGSDGGGFEVRFATRLGEDERLLMLAAALFIDMAFYE